LAATVIVNGDGDAAADASGTVTRVSIVGR
jgi:hypothetical protein